MTALDGPLVTLHGVTCDLGDGPVLDAVDLTIEPGAFLGVVGPSGSGKTTLLRTVLGTVTPTAGRVERRRGLRVGYVPQVETIDWTFPVTVTETVAMARPGRPWIGRRERADIAALLERLGLDGLADRHIRALSGGQQQRVFLARALITEPDLLLLDEPTSGVDVRTRHDLLHLLAHLHEQGRTILLSTHDLNGVATHLPDLVCLSRRITARGTPTDVLTPANLEATYGAPFDVLVHAGLPVVIDAPAGHHHPTAPTTGPGSDDQRHGHGNGHGHGHDHANGYGHGPGGPRG